MAELNYQINVGGNAGEAVGSLKKQLREAQQEVVALSEKFGATSKEAIEAAKRAAELKDRIGDAKALTDAFNPDAKFKALTASLSGVAGGFAAVQGAIGLFGTESQEVEKALLKLQSAMAISQGLQAIGESIDSFKQLGAVIQNSTAFIKLNELANKAAAGAMKLFGVAVETTSTSFKVLKGAIAATGIGLLVVAVGEIISAFQSWSSEADRAKAAQDKLNESVSKGAKIGLDSALQSLENQRKIAVAEAKAKDKSEKEILDIEQSFRKLKGEAQVRYWQEIKDIDKDGAMKAYDEVQKINTEGRVADLEFKAKQLEKEKESNKKKAEENKRANEELLKQQEEKRQKELEIEQKRRDAVLDVEKQIRAIRQETELIGLSEKDKRLLEAQQELDNNLKLYQDNLDARQKAYILYDEQIRLANAQTAVEEQEVTKKNNDTFLENLGKRGAAQIQAITTEQQLKTEAARADDELQRVKTQTQIGLASETLNVLGGLVDKNSVAGKAIAVSQAIINTYQGASKAIAQGGTFGPILAGVTIAAGLLNVKKIISTKIPSARGTGDVGGGGSAPSISSAAPIQPQVPQAATTNLSAQSINALGNQAIKAYVVETDVTTNQQRVKAIQQRARFD